MIRYDIYDHADGRKNQLPPCRVTNTAEELYKARGISLDEFDKAVEVNEIQVPNPELGPLESRVGKFYLDELFEDTGPDYEETAYWFHTPPGTAWG